MYELKKAIEGLLEVAARNGYTPDNIASQAEGEAEMTVMLQGLRVVYFQSKDKL